MHFYNWLTVVTVGFLAVIIPGPNMAVVVRNSLTHTRYSGVYTAAPSRHRPHREGYRRCFYCTWRKGAFPTGKKSWEASMTGKDILLLSTKNSV